MIDEKPDLNKIQDRIVELAKDLLMVDFHPMIVGLDAAALGGAEPPVRFASREKTEAFQRFVIILHAARGAAEEFRQAHVAAEKQGIRAEMDRQFQERVKEIEAMPLDPSEVEFRRAS